MDKEKIREVIFGINTKAGKRFDLILLGVIIISVIGIIISSDVEIEKKYGLKPRNPVETLVSINKSSVIK